MKKKQNGLSRIQCIDNNLIFTKDGEAYAYYEMKEYNNSFISMQKKLQVSDGMEVMIGQCGASHIHMLQIATESNIEDIQAKGKMQIHGEGKEGAEELVDIQTKELARKYGQRQVKFRHYIGFKLELEHGKLDVKEIGINFLKDMQEFLGSARHELMGDYLVKSKIELNRYCQAERTLYRKLTRHFGFQRVTPNTVAYIVEHLYGRQDVSFEDYKSCFHVTDKEEGRIYRKYDYLHLTGAHLHEERRWLETDRDEGRVYSAILALSIVIDDLVFPDSEILYHQQLGLGFPVDTSINVEVVENRQAIKNVNNKILEMDDLMEHAIKSDVSVSSEIVEANLAAEGLRDELRKTRDKLYRVSYLIRVWGSTPQELEDRRVAIKDYYDGYGMKLVCAYGNQIDFQSEFLPAGKRAVNDYVQPVKSDFLSCLGFGSTTKLGDGCGMYVGRNRYNDAPVYLSPWLAAQGIKGTNTNSLSCLFSGATGWGKSMAVKLLIYYLVVYGNQVLYIDPKSECGNWETEVPGLEGRVNIINLTSSEENWGMLDPYVMLRDINAAENLASDILAYLTGITVADEDRYPVLQEALQRVSKREERGLLRVIEELEAMGDGHAGKLAKHIGGFAKNSFARLLFSDGTVKGRELTFDKPLNVLEVAGLLLPERETPVEDYTVMNRLSIGMLMSIAEFSEKFMFLDPSVYKAIVIDEAWAMLGTERGRSLQSKGVRMGRSLNCAMYFVSQNVHDVGDAKMRNNIGMRFAFHADDEAEIRDILKFFDLDPDDENLHKLIRGLDRGECFFMDISGNRGIMQWDLLFRELYDAFDTSTGAKGREGTT